MGRKKKPSSTDAGWPGMAETKEQQPRIAYQLDHLAFLHLIGTRAAGPHLGCQFPARQLAGRAGHPHFSICQPSISKSGNNELDPAHPRLRQTEILPEPNPSSGSEERGDARWGERRGPLQLLPGGRGWLRRRSSSPGSPLKFDPLAFLLPKGKRAAGPYLGCQFPARQLAGRAGHPNFSMGHPWNSQSSKSQLDPRPPKAALNKNSSGHHPSSGFE
jgi:hypothetical protein